MSAQIQVGGTIPAQSVKESAPDATTPLVLTGKNIIVGVPGAFTGTCHAQVPGYLEAYNDFKAKGVNEIYIFAVNDVFVTKAWKENLAPKGSSAYCFQYFVFLNLREPIDVHFIADDTAAFAKSVGLSFDATPLLGGPRSLRYVIVTDNDKVASITVEENPGKLTNTAASVVLESL
ncbi:hypothetical protein DXG01_004127 [Tephrocybe rancida]|nr:hypothetical protein DXG01_004127 [Tephrocybe rancida]